MDRETNISVLLLNYDDVKKCIFAENNIQCITFHEENSDIINVKLREAVIGMTLYTQNIICTLYRFDKLVIKENQARTFRLLFNLSKQ